MKKNEQIVLDLFGLLDKQENNNFNIQDTTIKKDILLPSMDFSTLFSNIESIETIDNGYSMAILGDSLFVLRQMKEKSINLIFADAPYNIGKDFGNNNDKWESVKSYVDWCKQWTYDSSGVQSKKMFGSLYEPILMISKTQKAKYTFNCSDILVEAKTGAERKLIDYRKNPPRPYNTKKIPGNVWDFSRVRYRMNEYENHPTQKPEALLENAKSKYVRG